MKYTLSTIAIAIVLCAGFYGCNAAGKTGSLAIQGENFGKEGSYALGMSLGTSLKSDNIYPDMEEFIQGMRDILTDSETRYTLQTASQYIQEAYNALSEERDDVSKQAENEFLAENSKKAGINITASGLQYEVISEGDGEKPAYEDTVRVHYEGAPTDGTVFDSSYSRGEPTEFPLSGVIPGWTEGIQLMNVGSKYRFFIPSDLGYGSYGAGQQIPPYATLVFEVELLGVVR